MFRKSLATAIALGSFAFLPDSLAAQSVWEDELLHVEAPAEEVTASPQCGSGIKYDDGVFNDGYSLGNGDPGDATAVMKFDLPAGTTGLEQVCACFSRSSSGPPSMSYEVVVYNDNGAGGMPGTLLGTVNATASSIPAFPSTQFYGVDLTGAGITLPDSGVYIGVRWPGGQIFLCGDRSTTTPQRSSYGSGNSGVSWSSFTTLFPTVPPRALGIRTDPLVSAATCTPTATALCLNDGRFKVQATFMTPTGDSGQAQAVKLTDETGYFWFFNPVNVEVVLKVLDGCGVNNRYWVFAAGLTNVEVAITVTDTKTGAARPYLNLLNQPFQPVQDTSAFATCP